MTTQTKAINLDAQVCAIIEKDPDQIFWIRMEFGCDFLRHWIGDDLEEDRKLMEQLPDYWVWWNQTWENLDKRFVSRFEGRKVDAQVYKAIHNPKGIAMYPNRVIMEGYHKLIKRVANQHLTEQTT